MRGGSSIDEFRRHTFSNRRVLMLRVCVGSVRWHEPSNNHCWAYSHTSSTLGTALPENCGSDLRSISIIRSAASFKRLVLVERLSTGQGKVGNGNRSKMAERYRRFYEGHLAPGGPSSNSEVESSHVALCGKCFEFRRPYVALCDCGYTAAAGRGRLDNG